MRARLAAVQVGDGLAEAEHAHGDDGEVDAVAELGNAESEARQAGIDVDADGAEQHAEQDHADGLDHRAVGQDHGADQPNSISEK